MSKAFQVFIGYDPRQPVAYTVVAHSVASRLSTPVPITRLQLNQLPITRRGLTEFTYSRFLVPFLSDYDGYSLFLDADMLVLGDVTELLQHVDPQAAVSVVMHKEAFERPSLMLFNNKRNRNLTPEFVDNPTNSLFDMAWASKIGALPKDWNHVVGYNAPNPNAKVIHYTKGVPCWPETEHCDWAKEWLAEFHDLASTVPFQELMGGSVHVLKG
jgi:lipopolysaccharide biosynthesis glycosyltransferase